MSQSFITPVSVDSLASTEARVPMQDIMDLVKIFQNVSDPLLHESILHKVSEVEKEKLRELLNQKEMLLVQKDEQIREFESKIGDLRKQIQDVEDKNKQYGTTIKGFEKSLSHVMGEHQAAVEERDFALNHLANLEDAFRDLLEKYERAKNVIHGYQSNEAILKEQVCVYEESLNELEHKYDEFKKYTEAKLNEACHLFDKKDKNHIAQMAKLKARILQSQVQITDLQKKLTASDAVITMHSKSSIFQPLKNLIE